MSPRAPTPRADQRSAVSSSHDIARAGSDDPARAPLRPDFLAALARHHDLKRELAPLLSAWHAAGIETLLYKGFFLAEFVYPTPGTRFHGDVDALIRPEHAAEALRLALALGWRQRRYLPRVGAPDGAALFDLYRPGGATQLDVHRLLVAATRRWNRRQRAITDAVWASAERRDWEGTVIHTPAAVDAIVVNLALERGLSDAAAGLKAHDPADLAVLMARGRLSRDDLARRARALGCPRTLRRFLRLCDLAIATGSAPRPSALARLRWSAVGAVEGGFIHVPLPLLRAARAPALAWDIAFALPLVARVRRALRRRDVREVLASLTPAAAPRTPGSQRRRWRTIRAIYWVHALLPLGPARGDCLPRALAMYAALRRQGWNVTFVSGVRRDAGGLVGHAWVEEDGEPLRELGGWEPITGYQPGFRYPSDA